MEERRPQLCWPQASRYWSELSVAVVMLSQAELAKSYLNNFDYNLIITLIIIFDYSLKIIR